MTTLTRNGKLLEKGQFIPDAPELEIPETGTVVLHFVNSFGTPTCDECTNEVEEFHREKNPGISVISVNSQSATGVQIENEAEGQITHPRVSIGRESAINLSVFIVPGENAEKSFWDTALRRGVVVVKDRKVLDVQFPDDQEQKPDFQAAFEVAKASQKAA